MRSRLWMAALAVLFASLTTAVAQDATRETPPQPLSATAKAKDVRRLLQLTGAGQVGVQMMNQMFSTLRTSMPQVPASIWKEIMTEFKAEFSA